MLHKSGGGAAREGGSGLDGQLEGTGSHSGHSAMHQPCIFTEAHLQTGAKEALVEGIRRAIGSKGQLQAGQPDETVWQAWQAQQVMEEDN